MAHWFSKPSGVVESGVLRMPVWLARRRGINSCGKGEENVAKNKAWRLKET